MGRRHDWICSAPKCGHIVESVSGGPDRGFHTYSETRACAACHAVRDYYVAEVVRLEIWDSQPGPSCVCGADTTAWDHACPKCGAEMVIDPNGGIDMYD